MEDRDYTDELLQAIQYEEPELAQLCIENGADVNYVYDGDQKWTILHEAFDCAIDGMIQNDLEKPTEEIIRIIELLVNNGADPLKKDSFNKTPLDLLNIYTINIDGFNRNKDFFRAIISNIDDLVQYREGAKYWKYEK